MKYFYNSTEKNCKIECTDSLKRGSGYFLSGFNDTGDAGKLYIMVWDNGTCLTPVFDENGKNPIYFQYQGKEIRELNFNPLFK
jgi:hypothetical protein